MKAILEFNLDEEEDKLAYRSAQNGKNLECAISSFSSLLRTYRKYGVDTSLIKKLEIKDEESKSVCAQVFAAHIETLLSQCLEDYEATID